MHVSTEGKIGIGLALLGSGAGAAMTVWPTHIEIGWTMMAFAGVGGFLLLAYHCWDVGWLPWWRKAAVRMAPPPQSYDSPNDTLGRSGFVSLEAAAREIYGRLGRCTLRDWIDGAATGEHERLRVTAIVMLPYLALPGCQVWGLRPPSSRFEQISYIDLASRPLRVLNGAITLSDDADGRGYYRSLMVRDDTFADLWEAIEQAKNQPPLSPPAEPSVPFS